MSRGSSSSFEAPTSELKQLGAANLLPTGKGIVENAIIRSATLEMRETSPGRALFTYVVKWYERPNASADSTESEDLPSQRGRGIQDIEYMQLHDRFKGSPSSRSSARQPAEMMSFHSFSSPGNVYKSKSTSGSSTKSSEESKDYLERKSFKEAAATKYSSSRESSRNDRLGIRTGRCNGPCKRMLPAKELAAMQNCEHHCCSECIGVKPRIKSDATRKWSGCPNRKCLLNDWAKIVKDHKARSKVLQKLEDYHSETEATSPGSRTPLQPGSESNKGGNMITVVLTVARNEESLKNEKGEKIRHMEEEFHEATKLQDVLKAYTNEYYWLKDTLNKSKMFCAFGEKLPKNAEQWFRLRNQDMETKIGDIAMDFNYVQLILIGPA